MSASPSFTSPAPVAQPEPVRARPAKNPPLLTDMLLWHGTSDAMRGIAWSLAVLVASLLMAALMVLFSMPMAG